MADAPSNGGGMDLFWVVVVILVLFTMWIQGGGPSRAKNDGLFKINSPSSPSLSSPGSSNNSGDNSSTENSTESRYKGLIRLQRGTAASTYQPNQEYIVISANGNKNPVNLGGWVLRNGGNKKKYIVSGESIYGRSLSAVIPRVGFSLYNPYNVKYGKRASINLNSGERAVVVTGRFPSYGNILVKDNFKINRCLGYLEDITDYRFYPSLRYRCPSNNDVPGVSNLDDACYDFVRSINSCHTPKDVYIKDVGNCLDRNCKIGADCRNFVAKNYNFDSCFLTYSEDKDFVGPEWRIFLNRDWELWGDRRETISLYDSEGKLVDEISY